MRRSSIAYDDLGEAVRVAGAELKKGFAIDAWIEGPGGTTAADLPEIKRRRDVGRHDGIKTPRADDRRKSKSARDRRCRPD
jgi:hypothetical protein